VRRWRRRPNVRCAGAGHPALAAAARRVGGAARGDRGTRAPQRRRDAQRLDAFARRAAPPAAAAVHLSFKEIGQRLGISSNTVKTEAMSIYGKLGASTRSEAVEQAIAAGLLEDAFGTAQPSSST
jgi:hypothetical protein